MSPRISDTEKQLRQSFVSWLKRPGSTERFAAVMRKRDKRELDRLFAEAFSIDLPSWDAAIARTNSEVTPLPRIVSGTSRH